MILIGDLQVYESQIEQCLYEFLEPYCKPELNLTQTILAAPQNVFRAGLEYAREKTGLSEKLKVDGKLCNAWDGEKCLALAHYYVYLCDKFDKVIEITGFERLTGVSDQNIFIWRNKLTSLGIDNQKIDAKQQIYHVLSNAREASLAARLSDGKRQPIGILAQLNHWHSWNVIVGTSDQERKAALPASELPRLAVDPGPAAVSDHEADTGAGEPKPSPWLPKL